MRHGRTNAVILGATMLSACWSSSPIGGAGDGGDFRVRDAGTGPTPVRDAATDRRPGDAAVTPIEPGRDGGDTRRSCDTPPGALSAVELLRFVAQAACDRELRCGRSTASGDELCSVGGRLYDDWRRHQLETGEATIARDRVEACVATLCSAPCGVSGLPAECGSLLLGAGQPGGSCRLASDCRGEAVCRYDYEGEGGARVACSGTCRSPDEERCGSVVCDADERCASSGQCEPRSEEGEPCTSFRDCADDLFCGPDGVCTGPRGEGELCESDGICDEGLYCGRESLCEPQRGDGERCSRQEVCGEELFCNLWGRCEGFREEGEECGGGVGCRGADVVCSVGACRSLADAPASLGAPCVPDVGECEGTAVCAIDSPASEEPGVTLLPLTCQPPRPDGEPCRRDVECEGRCIETVESSRWGVDVGRCAPLLGLGASCSFDRHCESGHCILDVCRRGRVPLGGECQGDDDCRGGICDRDVCIAAEAYCAPEA